MQDEIVIALNHIGHVEAGQDRKHVVVYRVAGADGVKTLSGFGVHGFSMI
jgi:hypothetical protein